MRNRFLLELKAYYEEAKSAEREKMEEMVKKDGAQEEEALDGSTQD